MARPTKQGLEYFALDVAMNDEVELIEAVHGLVGFAVLIKLFQKIYSEGYYIDWAERDRILFSNRVSGDRNQVTSVVSDCIRWGIFDQRLYDKYGILTSRRIQDQYFAATYKRVNVIAVKEYLLIDVNDRNHVTVEGVSDIRNTATTVVTDDRNKATSRVSDDKSTQSKSNSKSKSNTLLERDKSLSCSPDGERLSPSESLEEKTDYQQDRFDQFWSSYPKKVGKQAALKAWKKLRPNKDLYSKIMAAVESQKKSDQWKTENGRYIPNPTTWLNQGRWDDELPKGNGRPALNSKTGVIGDNRYFEDDQPKYSWDATIKHYQEMTRKHEEEEARAKTNNQ